MDKSLGAATYIGAERVAATIDRRGVFGLAGGALSSLALSGGLNGGVASAATGAAQVEKALPDATNPFAARAYIYTIVTPDIDGSLRFYREVMGYEVIDRGALGSGISTIAGVGEGGRPYALLRHTEFMPKEHGVIRLLAAPRDALPNRPRPEASIVDPGLAMLECHPADAEDSYKRMVKQGVKTISPPKYYYFNDAQLPSDSGNSFSVFGPAGEQILLNCPNVPNTVDQKLPVDYKGVNGPLSQHTLIVWDRWPVLGFYGRALGLKQAADDLVPFDRLLAQETVDNAVGAPPGTYYRQIGLGGNELWEYRQKHPKPAPPWPTALDRTGLAMVTYIVDDLAAVRGLLGRNGIEISGRGGFPTPENKTRDAIYIRGPVGELLEVVGRA